MSLSFYASRLSEDFVSVVIEASRREFSPALTCSRNEMIVTGVSAGDLANCGQGMIRGTQIVALNTLTIIK